MISSASPIILKNPRLKKNNLDLLRLILASIVVISHTAELSGFSELNWLKNTLSASMAVKAFFVVSGFLIFMSFERSTSWKSYATKRIRRIYPAYITVIMLFGIGLVSLSSEKFANYFSLTWLKYIIANLCFLNFLQPTLPGVFESNPITAVNGSLWTLKIEVMFYISVPIFVFLFRRFSILGILIPVYGLSIVYEESMRYVASQTNSSLYSFLSHQFPAQLSYFLAGAFFYYFLPFFEKNISYFLGLATSILIIDQLYPLPPLEPFALATVVIFLGLFLYLGNIGKYGDFSYGVYILHFPIIQILLAKNWFSQNPWYFLISVMIITMIGAVALWHLVEKRFLLRNSHYRDTSTNASATASSSVIEESLNLSSPHKKQCKKD